MAIESIGKGYKLFRMKDGRLYPLYVLASKPTPMGVWLPAEEGPRTEDGHVQSKLGRLAYRPGWHINHEAPYVEHIYSKHDGKKYLKDGTIWAEVEYRTDTDYQSAADAEKGHYLRRIPVGGYYRYKTNPNMFGSWIIAGEMRVRRILGDDEVAELCRKHGVKPLPRWYNRDRGE